MAVYLASVHMQVPEAPQGGVLGESLGELGDALSRIGAVAVLVDAAERVLVEAASTQGAQMSSGAVTAGRFACGRGALERLGGCVGAEEAGNDHGRRGAKLLAREVDGLDGLVAPELQDVERVAVEAARINDGQVRGC